MGRFSSCSHQCERHLPVRTLGICIGATSLQYVRLWCDPDLTTVEESGRLPHEGSPQDAVLRFLSSIDTFDIDRIAVTGRSFRARLSLTTISEPEAIEHGLRGHYGADAAYPDVVVSSGGETQIVYRIDRMGGIASVHTGNKCASGTGEFFVQQIRRMGLSMEEAMGLAQEGTPHRIAGRCSVFCKSDCTHALNKGAAKADVVAGLCLMVADKIRELAKDIPCRRMLVIGGGSMNGALIGFLREQFGVVDAFELSPVFEAYGAALWARDNACRELPANLSAVVQSAARSFSTHPPLDEALDLVEFKEHPRGQARDGDRCVVGLDVGSTTTKAVLMRTADEAVVAATYLRTNGDPVSASRRCYAELLTQTEGIALDIAAVGVTGSGRQIAGLHALTDTVVNEIIAHATAAAYYDPDVDTIFEIGGQDAKYTYLTGGVPSDYAMNEACSAGTGSFLEESAAETLGVPVDQIAGYALRGTQPADFRDECAAFIASDIKLAGQEGVARDDILAGLVYSICLNYLNRVKGARPVGRKVFMQGGVCYNRAVPVAMAACMKTSIVVPPEPGLMGAFGAALEVRARLDEGLASESRIDLAELAARDMERESSFVCAGGPEKCDRKCEIARFRVAGKVYPFGGMCDRYYNLRLERTVDTQSLDFVARRQRLLFETYAPTQPSGTDAPSVGLCRSFTMHMLYPLFATFFAEMGFRVVLSDENDREGMERVEAQYCLPAQLSHGAFLNLLRRKPAFIFLPQIMQLPVPNVPTFSRLCVFVQGEPYYLRTTFRDELEACETTVLSPVLKLEQGYEHGEQAMVDLALRMGVPANRSRRAYAAACGGQRAFESDVRRLGDEALARLREDPDSYAVVLFGRPYNALADEANMGIPHKVASRGRLILSYDMLPADDYPVHESLFWATAQRIMKAAQYVRERDNLFGIFVTNFSCGPDSFVLSYFRKLMGAKPSLTLELDQHTANAGIDTRIEAALDIMSAWRRRGTVTAQADKPVRMARMTNDGTPHVVDSDGRRLALRHPDVEIVLPPMGRYSAAAVAAVMRGVGINARVLSTAGDRESLMLARRNATCKECLPYLVVTGAFLRYLQHERPPNRVTLLFIPTGGGPCRLGQYRRALADTVERKRLRNVAVLTVTDENGYGGMGTRSLLRAWQAIVLADLFEDMRSMLTVTAQDVPSALMQLDESWGELLNAFQGKLSVRISVLATLVARRIAQIPLKRRPQDVPAVALIGEYYVRKEEFSRRNVVDYLHRHGFAVRVAPAMEYLCYSNYNLIQGLQEGSFSPLQRLLFRVRAAVQEWWEWRLKSIMAGSGLYRLEMTDVARTIGGVRHLVNENFRGETILTVGSALREVVDHTCGVIAIGPFGCMPSRMAEAILKKEMNVAGKRRTPGVHARLEALAPDTQLPFLSIETDGNPFPQTVEANLEAFVVQARRLHETLAGGSAAAGPHKRTRAVAGARQPSS
ncbi:MAG: activase [Chitinivibrionales bacterium]|nr:activase [Chitinivibrionales bacterium]